MSSTNLHTLPAIVGALLTLARFDHTCPGGLMSRAELKACVATVSGGLARYATVERALIRAGWARVTTHQITATPTGIKKACAIALEAQHQRRLRA